METIIKKLELFLFFAFLAALIAGLSSFFMDFKSSWSFSWHCLVASSLIPILLCLSYMIAWGGGFRNNDGLPAWKLLFSLAIGPFYASFWIIFSGYPQHELPFLAWWVILTLVGVIIIGLSNALFQLLAKKSYLKRRIAYYLRIPVSEVTWALEQPDTIKPEAPACDFKLAHEAFIESQMHSDEERMALAQLLCSCQTKEHWKMVFECLPGKTPIKAFTIKSLYEGKFYL